MFSSTQVGLMGADYCCVLPLVSWSLALTQLTSPTQCIIHTAHSWPWHINPQWFRALYLQHCNTLEILFFTNTWRILSFNKNLQWTSQSAPSRQTETAQGLQAANHQGVTTVLISPTNQQMMMRMNIWKLMWLMRRTIR